MSTNGLVAGFTKGKQRRLHDLYKLEARLETFESHPAVPGRATIPRLHSILLWHEAAALVIPLAGLTLL